MKYSGKALLVAFLLMGTSQAQNNDGKSGTARATSAMTMSTASREWSRRRAR
jgi:hypothetical protein